jgi:hypothetical protein
MSAALLLLVGTARHYGYALAPPDAQADVWNIAGALTIIALLWSMRRGLSPMAGLIALWFAAEELLVAGCSAAWLVQPWAVMPGDEQCSAKIGLKIGALSLIVVAILAAKLLEPQIVQPE